MVGQSLSCQNGCQIKITDPFADLNAAEEHYKIELTKIDEMNDFDVIIIDVAHNDYSKIKISPNLGSVLNAFVIIDEGIDEKN